MKKAPMLSRRERFLARNARRTEIDRVRHLVEKRLARHQSKTFRLVVSPTLIECHDGRWYVVVEPDDTTVGFQGFQRSLMKTENDLFELDGLSVLLASMLPMDDELEHEMPVLWAVFDSARQ